MIPDAGILLALLACYVAGSVPFGLLVARARGVDIRAHGSGNIGATNVARVLGRRMGIWVFGLDALKGMVPTVVVGRMLHGRVVELDPAGYGLWVAAAALCVLGHIYPVYLRFKGGKGVATALGATLAVYPDLTWPSLICLAVWVLVTATSRYVSLGSLAAAAAFPITVWLFLRWFQGGGLSLRWPLLAYSGALAALVAHRHRPNIARLLAGTENKICRS